MQDIESKKFGRLIRQKLIDLDVSQKSLENELGRSKSTVSAFLDGLSGRNVSTDNLRAYQGAINRIAERQGRPELKITPDDIDHCANVFPKLKSSLYDQIRDSLFVYDGGEVNAVRLWGRSYHSIDQAHFKLRYSHTAIHPPVEQQAGYYEFIEERRYQLASRDVEFFNGPCVRLTDFKVSPETGRNAAAETPSLAVQLAPVSWYEYSFLRSIYEGMGKADNIESSAARFIDLEGLVRNGNIRGSRSSNIVDTATTIVTTDGYLGYQARSDRVSSGPSLLTSSVAENINRWKDECKLDAPFELVDAGRHYMRSQSPVDHTYAPSGPPNPFWTARRGINSELADGVSSWMSDHSLRLTGISFDLMSGHPDFLFVALVGKSRAELQKRYLEEQGAEVGEGKLRFVPASFEDPETQEVLSSNKWIPAGKASLVRALEYMNSIKRYSSGSFQTAFELISTGRV